MLLHVPASLDGLLSLFSGCFTKPTLQTFRALVIGQISQTGARTVTGMLVGARLSAVWDHCRAHRFFSRARWSPNQLGLVLAELIAQRFTQPGSSCACRSSSRATTSRSSPIRRLTMRARSGASCLS